MLSKIRYFLFATIFIVIASGASAADTPVTGASLVSGDNSAATATDSSSQKVKDDGKTIVYVTTPMPGMSCEPAGMAATISQAANSVGQYTSAIPGMGLGNMATSLAKIAADKEFDKAPLYRCSIPSGISGFLYVMKGFLKYGIFIGLLLGILMLVVSGIRISLSKITGDDSTAKAKQAFLQVLGGLVVLILFGVILNTIAPWIFR